MSPASPLHDLSFEAFRLLRYGLAAVLLVYLPGLGALVAGSAASVALNFLGRESRDARTLRLSKDLIGLVAIDGRVLSAAALLPAALVLFLCGMLVPGPNPLPRALWPAPLAAIAAGCALLVRYRRALARPGDLPARELGGGAAGHLAAALGSYLLFAAVGILVNPSKLPLIRANPVFVFSWASVAQFHVFLALSFVVTGALVMRSIGRTRPDDGEADVAYGEYARSIGTRLVMAGALAVPPFVVLDLIAVGPVPHSAAVFALAGSLLLLAAAAALSALRARTAPAAGAVVPALTVAMFLVLVVQDQALIANAYRERFPSAVAPEPAQEPSGPAAQAGKAVFESACRACHLFESKLVGPPLGEAAAKYRGDVEKLKAYIRNPVKVDPAYPPMPAPDLKDDEIAAVAGYVLARAGSAARPPAPAAQDAAAERGRAVFESTCAPCHRFDGRLVGPPLDDVVPKYRGDVERLARFIADPVKVDPAYPPMPKHALSPEQVRDVARYLLSRAGQGR